MSRHVLDRAAKRGMDVVLSAAGLLMLSPLLLVVAVWVRLDTSGPALYRQVRVGRGGRHFRIHKFRTMRAATAGEGGGDITVGRDSRITRAGALLRHTKLDELPQLVDVLLGDMSLVGPRPELPAYVALYPDDVRERVLSVRPGITDVASLAYRDESELLASAVDPERAYREVVLPAKLHLSTQYLEHATVASDLCLMGRTLKTIFTS